MTVYVDFVLLLNFAFDFLLLLTTSIVLRKNANVFFVVLGAFIGSLSILILFFDVSSLMLFFVKFFLSILMILVTFKYRRIKDFVIDLVTFYVVSFLFGGFLYMLNIEFSYKHDGLVFYNNGLSINVLILFIISPLILYIYVKQNKVFRIRMSNYYEVCLVVGDSEMALRGYLDTGNSLSYNGKPVIITNLPNTFSGERFFVPYVTIGKEGVIECVSARVLISELGVFDVFLGFSENMNISGADVLLNRKMEDGNVK